MTSPISGRVVLAGAGLTSSDLGGADIISTVSGRAMPEDERVEPTKSTGSSKPYILRSSIAPGVTVKVRGGGGTGFVLSRINRKRSSLSSIAKACATFNKRFESWLVPDP